MFYLRLLHGRKTLTEKMEDWGKDGPIIGPVSLSWTYGTLKVHPPSEDDFEFLPIVNDLVFYDSMYFGDVDFISENDPLINERKQVPHNWENFKKNIGFALMKI